MTDIVEYEKTWAPPTLVSGMLKDADARALGVPTFDLIKDAV